MKIFISWSGERSHAVAEALRQWLPNVIQVIRPWMSAVDIDKGVRWSADIAVELEETSFGVICLTPENLEAPWILFEAGALSKKLAQTFVCPYLFDVEPRELKGPLVQFQATRANKADTLKLVHTINRALSNAALPADKLDKTFEVWWPELEQMINSVPDMLESPKPKRPAEEMVGEILEIVRSLERDRPDPIQSIFSRHIRGSRPTLTGRSSILTDDVLRAIGFAANEAAQKVVTQFTAALRAEGIISPSLTPQTQVAHTPPDEQADSGSTLSEDSPESADDS